MIPKDSQFGREFGEDNLRVAAIDEIFVEQIPNVISLTRSGGIVGENDAPEGQVLSEAQGQELEGEDSPWDIPRQGLRIKLRGGSGDEDAEVLFVEEAADEKVPTFDIVDLIEEDSNTLFPIVRVELEVGVEE